MHHEIPLETNYINTIYELPRNRREEWDNSFGKRRGWYFSFCFLLLPNCSKEKKLRLTFVTTVPYNFLQLHNLTSYQSNWAWSKQFQNYLRKSNSALPHWKRTFSKCCLLFPAQSSTERRKRDWNFHGQNQTNKTVHGTPWQVQTRRMQNCIVFGQIFATKKGLTLKYCYKKFFFFLSGNSESENSHVSPLFIHKLASCKYLQLWSPHKTLPDTLFCRRIYHLSDILVLLQQWKISHIRRW